MIIKENFSFGSESKPTPIYDSINNINLCVCSKSDANPEPL